MAGWPKTLSILNGAPLIPLSITVMFVFRALLADLITIDDAYKSGCRTVLFRHSGRREARYPIHLELTH